MTDFKKTGERIDRLYQKLGWTRSNKKALEEAKEGLQNEGRSGLSFKLNLDKKKNVYCDVDGWVSERYVDSLLQVVEEKERELTQEITRMESELRECLDESINDKGHE